MKRKTDKHTLASSTNHTHAAAMPSSPSLCFSPKLSLSGYLLQQQGSSETWNLPPYLRLLVSWAVWFSFSCPSMLAGSLLHILAWSLPPPCAEVPFILLPVSFTFLVLQWTSGFFIPAFFQLPAHSRFSLLSFSVSFAHAFFISWLIHLLSVSVPCQFV